MISNRCARKSLVTNCNSIISKNYLRFLVDSNELKCDTVLTIRYKMSEQEKDLLNKCLTEIFSCI